LGREFISVRRSVCEVGEKRTVGVEKDEDSVQEHEEDASPFDVACHRYTVVVFHLIPPRAGCKNNYFFDNPERCGNRPGSGF
jgi:hypothetical protein